MTNGLDEYVQNSGKEVSIKLAHGVTLIGKIIDETPLYYVLRNNNYSTQLVFKANILFIDLH